MLLHSLLGTALIGCGPGGGCDSVMGSRWGYFLGNVPVSLPAAACYVVLLLCALFVGGKSLDEVSMDRTVWAMMLVMAGSIAGCALWFCWLQAGVLHSFCKWCSLLHLLGCFTAVEIFRYAPCRRRPVFLAVGLACAALFVALQVRTAPEFVYDEGRTESPLPAFSSAEMYSVGPEDAGAEVELLFDFQCVHCRRMHVFLQEACERAGVKAVLCPVPLSNDCNPYIPDGTDRFKGSCEITDIALAVWLSRPELYPSFEAWLMEGEDCPSPASVRCAAEGLLGAEELESALSDERITAYLRSVYELFGRTSSSEKSGIPRFVFGGKWIVPEVESADGLAGILNDLAL